MNFVRHFVDNVATFFGVSSPHKVIMVEEVHDEDFPQMMRENNGGRSARAALHQLDGPRVAMEVDADIGQNSNTSGQQTIGPVAFGNDNVGLQINITNNTLQVNIDYTYIGAMLLILWAFKSRS